MLLLYQHRLYPDRRLLHASVVRDLRPNSPLFQLPTCPHTRPELAHVAWRCRNWDAMSDNPDEVGKEAVLSPSEEQIELGQAWENWFFGGALQPIDTYETPTRWLGYSYAPFTIDTCNNESLAYQDCRLGGRAIPAASINQFFRRDRWKSHRDGTWRLSVHETPVSSLTGEPADTEDRGFVARLTANHKGGSRPPFLVKDWLGERTALPLPFSPFKVTCWMNDDPWHRNQATFVYRCSLSLWFPFSFIRGTITETLQVEDELCYAVIRATWIRTLLFIAA